MKLILICALLIIATNASAFCEKSLNPLTFINKTSCEGSSEGEAQFQYLASDDIRLRLIGEQFEGCRPVTLLWEEYDSEGNVVSAHNANWGMYAEAGKEYKLRVMYSQKNLEVACQIKLVVGPNLEE